MAEPALQSAMADLLRPRLVGPDGKAGLRLSERTGLAIWQIAAWREADIPALRSALRKSLRLTLPEQPNGAATDLSHSRVVLRLSGPKAGRMLAKLCRIDLHPKAFPPGRTAQTPLGQVAALIHCVDATPSFDLYLPRSLARSATEMVIDAGAEFGLEIRT